MKKLIFLLALASASPSVMANSAATTSAANKENADFVAGSKAIGRRDWKAAVESFNKAAQKLPENADVQNNLGYAYRQLGELDKSFVHYKEALRIDPKHRGAHEYIGEAYLKAKQPEKAAEHLAALEGICGKGCEEYQDLARAIDKYKQSN
ncbi:MAG: tetratricopeptide repeat protein [Burkholderiaceae bacterium]